MRPFLISIAIFAGSVILVFLVFAAIQAAIQIASLFPTGSVVRYEAMGLLDALATHVIATTAIVVISIVAGWWLWINKNVHPLLFKTAVGIVLGVVIAFILYMVYLPDIQRAVLGSVPSSGLATDLYEDEQQNARETRSPAQTMRGALAKVNWQEIAEALRQE
jgi:hypothetical protein